MELTLSSLLDMSAGRFPNDEAVIIDYSRVTFSQLHLRVNKRANALLELGIGKGQHVGVLAAHSMGLAETMLAIWRTGAVFVPLNYRNAEDTFSVELMGRNYEQGTFKYQLKCLSWLQEEYSQLQGAPKERVDAVLAESGCLLFFRTLLPH